MSDDVRSGVKYVALIVISYILVGLVSFYFVIPYFPELLTFWPTLLGIHAVVSVGLSYLLMNKTETWSNILAGFSLVDMLLLGWLLTGTWLGPVIGLVVWIGLCLVLITMKIRRITGKENKKVGWVNTKQTKQTKRPAADTASATIGVAGVNHQGIPAESRFNVAHLLGVSEAGQELQYNDQVLRAHTIRVKEIEEQRLSTQLNVEQNRDRVNRWFELYKLGPPQGITRERLNELLVSIGEEPLDPVIEPTEEDMRPKDRASRSNKRKRTQRPKEVDTWGVALLKRMFGKAGNGGA